MGNFTKLVGSIVYGESQHQYVAGSACMRGEYNSGYFKRRNVIAWCVTGSLSGEPLKTSATCTGTILKQENLAGVQLNKTFNMISNKNITTARIFS